MTAKKNKPAAGKSGPAKVPSPSPAGAGKPASAEPAADAPVVPAAGASTDPAEGSGPTGVWMILAGATLILVGVVSTWVEQHNCATAAGACETSAPILLWGPVVAGAIAIAMGALMYWGGKRARKP